LISMRKSLDMDAELGSRLESLRQEEITQVFEKRQAVAQDNPIEGVMAVSFEAALEILPRLHTAGRRR